ncbi:MAG: diacylglycerol kinase family lipid kinase [Acidobacteria bacterium]|nr:MAG: diacylglycerol kinase family lipid kinase [Acidobacteriota bacterium]
MKVIANPEAGRGRGSRQVAQLRRWMEEHRVEHELLITERPGHATELAGRAAASGARRLIVAGGDGTISEVANALVVTEVEMGIVAIGTGNDVARTLNLPYNDVAKAADIATGGRVRSIDLGREGGRFFVSSVGLGFASDVVEQSNRPGWLTGSAAFFVAVHRALRKLRSIRIVLELDGAARELDCVSVLVQNTAYTGGGLRIAPEATVDDGLLDVAVIGPIGKLNLVANFPKLYRGTHSNHPQFALYRARKVRVQTAVPLPKMLDGDICGSSPLEAEIVPQALKVVVDHE